MLLTITTTHQPATDLGYLLYKNPANVQTFELPVGKAHVFYPDASNEKCTVALLLDIDPIALVRGRKDSKAEGSLDQYVNDRPYVASSFLSVAMANIFGNALSGKCRERPELVDTKLPLEARIPIIPSPGGENLLRRLFEPLGYSVETVGYPLDEKFAEWGASPYYSLQLTATCTLHDLLSHLYVLIPVLDYEKHYYVGDDEVAKLLRHGEGWLSNHPEKTFITNRYLQHKNRLTRMALDRLSDEDELDVDAVEEQRANEEAAIEQPISLNERRIGTVLAVLKEIGARRVMDVGCGEGKLVGRLLQERELNEIVGLDVSFRALEKAKERLKFDRMTEKQKERLAFLQGSLTYRDKRMEGFDAVTCVEVVEHLDPPRLSAFERVLFDFAKPGVVILTTPNVEYNKKFENLPAGKFRHRDHRFEWNRSEFQAWANNICSRYKYSVRFLPIGDDDAELGPPTQMAVFSK